MTMQTVVLVPGLLTDADLFAAQIRGLADVARVIVADISQDDTMAAMASRLLASVEGPFALAGLSMGGYVAQEVMRQAPERVTRLALLDTNARADRPEQAEQRRALVKKAQVEGLEAVADALLPMLVHPDRLADAALVERVRAMAVRVGHQAFARQQEAIISRLEGLKDLAKITVPTLCLCGRNDAMTPPKVHQEMVDRLPAGVLVEIDDCGHLATIEQPQAVTALFRYWLWR